MFKKNIIYALIFLVPVLSGCTKNVNHFDIGLKAYQNKNYKVALKNFKPLAEQGNANAQFNLGLMYNYGHGVPQDYKQAVYWYKKSTEQGNAKAQNNLGAMYYNGQGVPQDTKQAIHWFTKSAKQGNADAQSILGAMYGAGQGVPQDFVIAYVWFNISVINGNKKATEGREIVLKAMTPNQITTAKKISEKCYNSNYKNCTKPTSIKIKR